MKAYGHTRRDKLECKFGCCAGKSGAKKDCREIVDRSRRKKARQHKSGDCRSIFTDLLY